MYDVMEAKRIENLKEKYIDAQKGHVAKAEDTEEENVTILTRQPRNLPDKTCSIPLFNSKCCVPGKNFEVSILVQDYKIISDGNRGDQAIDKLSDGLPTRTTLAI